MKKYTVLTVVFSMVVFLSASITQEKNEKDADYKYVIMMMQDSTMANKMIAHIAKDDNLRGKMMQEVMAFCKSDTSKMKGMCKMMMQDKETSSTLKEMMQGEIKPMSIKPMKLHDPTMKVKK